MTRATVCVILLLGLMLTGICSSCGSDGGSDQKQDQSLIQEDTLPISQPATPVPPPKISDETKKVIEKQKDASPFREKGCCKDAEKTATEDCCCKEVLAAYKKMVAAKDKQLVTVKTKDPILKTCRDKHPKEFYEVDYPPGSEEEEVW